MVFNNYARYGEPTVYVTLIGNHGLIGITYCRWGCGSLVTQYLQSLLLSKTYQFLLSLIYHCDCL